MAPPWPDAGPAEGACDVRGFAGDPESLDVIACVVIAVTG